MDYSYFPLLVVVAFGFSESDYFIYTLLPGFVFSDLLDVEVKAKKSHVAFNAFLKLVN